MQLNKCSYGCFGITLIFASLWLFYHYYTKAQTILPSASDENTDKDVVKLALDIYTDSSKSLATITIGLLVAVWGFIFSSERMKDISSELVLLLPIAGSSLFLIASVISYDQMESVLITLLFEAETIDLKAEILTFWKKGQQDFFYYGFASTVVSFFLLNKKS